MPEKNEVKDANPLKKEKCTPKFVHLNICILCFLDCVDLRKSPKN